MIIINTRDFAKQCALETGLTQSQAYEVLTYIFNTAKTELINGGTVDIPGIGKISPVNKKTRKHYHPVSKGMYESVEYKTIKMDIYPSLKKKLNA